LQLGVLVELGQDGSGGVGVHGSVGGHINGC
jgi:hypothetical protein